MQNMIANVCPYRNCTYSGTRLTWYGSDSAPQHITVPLLRVYFY